MGTGKPYSMDLRQRVVAAIEGGLSTRQAAARFAIGIATAGTWARLKRATGAVRPAKQGKPMGAVRQAIEACGAELRYLPPYSPDFNPIENAFAKFKAHLRKSAARTLDALERAAANALQQFKPDECANFFAHAGYGLD